jgi:hypothetical protein
MYRYAGWIVGERPIGGVTVDKSVLEGMDGLRTDTLSGASSPDPFIYTMTHDVDYNSGRMVWAYPAQYGECASFKDGLGVHAITDSYVLKTCTVDGVAYNCYVLRNYIANDEGTEYPQVFIGA